MGNIPCFVFSFNSQSHIFRKEKGEEKLLSIKDHKPSDGWYVILRAYGMNDFCLY